MAVGDVTVTLVENWNTTTLDTAMTALRSAGGASGTYLMTSTNNGQDIVCLGIEES
jgi:hypothetical protein